jgi:phosphopantothenoylcysteine decarboxylase / phosphopantothenate---cysteine ligase
VVDLQGARVLLGVTGGIAAYKAALLARLLVGAGATVDPVLTAGAARFVGAATFEGVTGRRVRTEVWEDIPAETHVALGRAAELAVVYPATANVLAKLAHGLADDLLTTTLLASTCPLVVAPAMHTEMWEHAATQRNVALLRERGVHVLGPATGRLMGGDEGPGRLTEPEEALALLGSLRRSARDLAGTTVVVTAGGTREPIDPVRFLGNRSTGKMGFAVAAAAAARGAEVHLVAAPTSLPTPSGVTRHEVTTAVEMHAAVLDLVDRADVVVKAAAVADFRPAETATSKLKKDAGVPAIELVRNPTSSPSSAPVAREPTGRCSWGSPPRPTTWRPTAAPSSSASRPTCSWSTTSAPTTPGSRSTPTAWSSWAVTAAARRWPSRPRPRSPAASSTRWSTGSMPTRGPHRPPARRRSTSRRAARLPARSARPTIPFVGLRQEAPCPAACSPPSP